MYGTKDHPIVLDAHSSFEIGFVSSPTWPTAFETEGTMMWQVESSTFVFKGQKKINPSTKHSRTFKHTQHRFWTPVVVENWLCPVSIAISE